MDGLEIQRAYTPISPANAEGYFEVLIKVSRPTRVPFRWWTDSVWQSGWVGMGWCSAMWEKPVCSHGRRLACGKSRGSKGSLLPSPPFLRQGRGWGLAPQTPTETDFRKRKLRLRKVTLFPRAFSALRGEQALRPGKGVVESPGPCCVLVAGLQRGVRESARPGTDGQTRAG